MRDKNVVLIGFVLACQAPLPSLVSIDSVPPRLLDIRGQFEIGVEGTIATMPLIGGRVELVGVGLVTHTDATGEYAFRGIPVELLSNRLEFLVFDAAAMESDPPMGRFLEEISMNTVGSVTFPPKVVNPRGAITGRVDLVGDDNDGGVLVYAEGLPGVDDLTGPDGSFVLLGVPAGEVKIRSNRDGFMPTPDAVTVVAQAHLRLPVEEPILLNPIVGQPMTALTGGTVQTIDGRIPVGAEVWAVPQISGDVSHGVVRMPVTSDGRFRGALHFSEPHHLILKSGGVLATARRLQVQPGRQDVVLVGLPMGAGSDDRDGDGRVGEEDFDDTDPHSWSDLDGDGFGDIHDWDDDSDELGDMEELCPGRDGSTSNPRTGSEDRNAASPDEGGISNLGGTVGELVGPDGSTVEEPSQAVQAGFQDSLAQRMLNFGTVLLEGPYVFTPSEPGDFQLRNYGYLGSLEDRVELVIMPLQGCQEWQGSGCSSPFNEFNISAYDTVILQKPAVLEVTGRGRLKMSVGFQLRRQSLVWVWLPGGQSRTPLCGNGIVNPGEICDDGNLDESDDCTTACLPPTCGDGIAQVALGEGCDDGNGIATDDCTNQCQHARCGDGLVRVGEEECDDGNNQDRDGCSSSCQIECVLEGQSASSLHANYQQLCPACAPESILEEDGVFAGLGRTRAGCPRWENGWISIETNGFNNGTALLTNCVQIDLGRSVPVGGALVKAQTTTDQLCGYAGAAGQSFFLHVVTSADGQLFSYGTTIEALEPEVMQVDFQEREARYLLVCRGSGGEGWQSYQVDYAAALIGADCRP